MIGYDFKFNSSELKEIKRLRKLDENRKTISFIVGFTVFLAIFFSQSLFHGNEAINSLATNACIPLGILVGIILNKRMDSYIEREFLDKWDPIYYSRSGSSQEKVEATKEIIKVTDSDRFIALPEDKQRKIMRKINDKHGL